MTATVSVVVMAHRRRAQMVDQLLGWLDRSAQVVWDEKGDRWDTGRRAWLAVDRTAPYGLVVQDDAIPCRDLVAGVEQALAHVPEPSPLCLYLGRVRPYREMITQLISSARGNTSWITMPQIHWGPGIVMPTHLIDDMIEWCDQRGEIPNYDRRISRWCQYRGLTVWYPWPSLVDHREVSRNPSLVPGRTGDRRAHRFLGADVSALGQRWDGGVITMADATAAQSTDSGPVPVVRPPKQRLGAKMRFVSTKYRQLLVAPARLRFRDGKAATNDPAAIAVLLSPKVAAMGVRPVEEPSDNDAEQVPAGAGEGAVEPLAGEEPVADGEQGDRDADADEGEGPAGPVDQPGGVPDAGAKEILAWVGDDPQKARQALNAEQEREKPRSTLVATLTKLTG